MARGAGARTPLGHPARLRAAGGGGGHAIPRTAGGPRERGCRFGLERDNRFRALALRGPHRASIPRGGPAPERVQQRAAPHACVPQCACGRIRTRCACERVQARAAPGQLLASRRRRRRPSPPPPTGRPAPAQERFKADDCRRPSRAPTCEGRGSPRAWRVPLAACSRVLSVSVSPCALVPGRG